MSDGGTGPDARGYFGEYGGKFVPETLIQALSELERLYEGAKQDEEFSREFIGMLREYAGRPTALTLATRPILLSV